MYYVIESKYVGPNQDQAQYCDVDTIGIYTTPGKTNSSREVRLEGWLGTNNDWAEYAHGEFATLEAAKTRIEELYEHTREQDTQDSYDEDLVELYKPGQYEQMSRQATADWCYEGIRADITADTTDGQIARLVGEYEDAANAEGFSLDGDLMDMMSTYRQELRDERDELEADEDE